MRRSRAIASLAFAWIAYLLFARSMVYLIAFVADRWVAKTIDRGPESTTGVALAIDTLLMLAFAAHHSVMARAPSKRWVARWITPVFERSSFVLVSSLLLIVLIWQWRPIPATVWEAPAGPWASALRYLSLLGWGGALLASLRLGHLETFGLRRVLRHLRGQPSYERPLVTRAPYGWLRHPMYLGFLIGIWATPRMSAGHLLFSSFLSGYLMLGRSLEERDLARRWGADYQRYRERVAAFVPRWRRPGKPSGAPGEELAAPTER